MTWWQAVVLGLVEGVTEYLPVSSTGHLILAASLMRLDHPDAKDAVDAFIVVVQGGAILAVLALYWPRVVQMIRGLFGRDDAGFRLACNLGIAFAPAALAGLLLSKPIKTALFGPWPVLARLPWAVHGWCGSVAGRNTGRTISPRCRGEPRCDRQCRLALWPGTSRSMVTIGAGMVLGLRAVPRGRVFVPARVATSARRARTTCLATCDKRRPRRAFDTRAARPRRRALGIASRRFSGVPRFGGSSRRSTRSGLEPLGGIARGIGGFALLLVLGVIG